MRTRPELPAEHPEDIGELSDIVGFHIRLAHGACYRHFTETFADLDLTQKQASVLWLVDDHPGISQIELGGRLRMDRATTMAMVNKLQGRDLMRRERSRDDGRKQALYLTEAGQHTLLAAKDAIRSHERWVKSRFNDTEVAQLIEMLSRIHE
jgi:DNA-binding MarR family transcriptional regulator